jgi:hypothetical protein
MPVWRTFAVDPEGRMGIGTMVILTNRRKMWTIIEEANDESAKMFVVIKMGVKQIYYIVIHSMYYVLIYIAVASTAALFIHDKSI